MSTRKEAYVQTFMQKLAGDGIDLNPKLAEIFSGVLLRQLEEDEGGSIVQKGNFEMLAKVFTFVATTPGEEGRPLTPMAYDNSRIQEAQQSAALAAGDSTGDEPETISVDIGRFHEDTGTIDFEFLDAGQGSYIFTDDASVETFVQIENFTADDKIQISNLPAGGMYSFVPNGNDVDITYNHNDETPLNHIKLLGVGDPADVYYGEGQFEAAIGFDAITFA